MPPCLAVIHRDAAAFLRVAPVAPCRLENDEPMGAVSCLEQDSAVARRRPEDARQMASGDKLGNGAPLRRA